MTARRGSVLIMALWIIAILSVMVVSFAFEARQQAGIDVYVRERNRVSRLIESGRVLGETVLLGYKDAPEPEIKSGAPDWDDAFEEDRWVVEKYALKQDHKCKIGPIDLDGSAEGRDEEAEDVEPATVTVELTFFMEKRDGDFLSQKEKSTIVRVVKIPIYEHSQGGATGSTGGKK